MSEATIQKDSPPGWSRGRTLLALLPLLGAGLLIAMIFLTGTGLGTRATPPLEDLTIERVTLPREGQITLTIVNGGVDPVRIAQVLVDDAFWQFTVTPEQTISRLGRATVQIPYPWVQDEAHAITLLTSTGATFEAEVPIAVQTPGADASTFWQYTLLGIYVGVIPVALGLAWHPFLRQLGRNGLNLVLSLTIGLLLFLFVDTLLEAVEISLTLPGALQGEPLVWLLMLSTVLGLQSIGGRRKESSRLMIATFIALGIGLHNLGEGLAIGAALASGEAALGTFLVLGFTLHNITEGIGIAAPVADQRLSLWRYLGLGLLAGAPAILGTWIGGFAYSPFWTVVFLAIGAGAILQVIWAVGQLLLNDARKHQESVVALPNLVGLFFGMGIMYATALLVTA